MIESLLPENATAAERALELATARAFELPVPIPPVWNPWTCPIEILPWLAWAMSVDEWDPAWTETTKRMVVAESYAIHLKKGTRQSIERVLELVGFPDSVLTEWWETPTDPSLLLLHSSVPHTFSIGFDPLCTPAGIVFDPAVFARLSRLLAHTAPVRSHMCLYLNFRTEASLGVAPVVTGIAQNREVLCLEGPAIPAVQGMGIASVATATAVICLASEL